LASIEALNKTNTTTKKRVTKHLADILKFAEIDSNIHYEANIYTHTYL
jgi:hypothetical protein